MGDGKKVEEIKMHEIIKQYEEQTRNAAAKAIKEEKRQVNINPNCFVARELMYQTAILKNIERHLYEIKRDMR